MMRQGHAVSGLAAGLGVASAAAQLGAPIPLPAILIGAALTAGAALIPDIDCPGATVTRTFGPLSELLSENMNDLSAWVYEKTKTELDEDRDGGHRGLTHTWPFALALGGACALFAQVAWCLLVILFACICLTLQGLLGKHARLRLPLPRALRHLDDFLPDKLALWIVSAALAGALWFWLPPEFSPGAIGALVGFGCMVHCWGDSLTLMGCPWMWPVPIAGQRWYPIGSPEFLRFRAGGWAEIRLVLPLLFIVTVTLLVDAVPGGWEAAAWAWGYVATALS